MLVRWAEVLVTALLLLTLRVPPGTPPVRPRPWLIAFAVGVALIPAAELASLMLPMDSQ
jgi:hypothetical protein